jgi:hypothetical protein
MLAILERSARRLVPYSSVPSDVVEKQHPPLPAYESYVKGLLAETPATAITYLHSAITLAPTFDRARLALASTQSEVGNYEAARTAALAIGESSPSRRDGQFAAALAEINLKRFDDAFARLQQMNATAPTPELLTNLGVIQLRRTPTAQQGRATYFLHKAVELNTMSADAMFNLGVIYDSGVGRTARRSILVEGRVRYGRRHAAISCSRRRSTATGAGTEGGRERELAWRPSAGMKKESGSNATAVLRGSSASRSFSSVPRRAAPTLRWLRPSSASNARWRRSISIADAGLRARADRAALTELRRAPLCRRIRPRRTCSSGGLHLRAGRTRDAIEALKISGAGDGRSARRWRGLSDREERARPRTRPSAPWR